MPLRKSTSVLNRELSWLAFNRRVLAEASDPEVPLLERLKFLAIVSSNLDEFVMIRMAGLTKQVLAGERRRGADGLSPRRQRGEAAEEIRRIVDEASRVYRKELLPALAARGIRIGDWADMSGVTRAQVEGVFRRQIVPALAAPASDPTHPIPHIANKPIHLAALLETGDGTEDMGVVALPRTLDRLVRLPAPQGEHHFLLLEDALRVCLGDLFPGKKVKGAWAFRVTRDGDLTLDSDEEDPLLLAVERELRRRDWGIAVRLEVEEAMPPRLETMLRTAVGLEPADSYRTGMPLQAFDLMAVATLADRPDLRDPPFTSARRPPLRGTGDIFDVISRGDVLLHHPYESFRTVVRFLQEAARDPAVVSIQQTLYRTGGDSPAAGALARAARAGKQVSALIELRARFEEYTNIRWARELEQAGVRVVYGLMGLKTHAKMTLVTRREGTGLRRYLHLGTGNYNPVTARSYTDLGILTADPDLAADAEALFRFLDGQSRPVRWRRMSVAPLGLKERVVALVDRERREAEAGRPARIAARLNAVVDREVIRALYAASRAGVPIDLVVRGICCLRPGVPGQSETIRVRSVVDRFLEHERVFVFGTGDRREVYLSSADWMPRNFLQRVEVMWPVLDPALRDRLEDEVLGAALADNRKAWLLRPDGSYERAVPAPGEPVFRSQERLLALERRNAAAARRGGRPRRKRGVLVRRLSPPRREPPWRA